MTKVRAGFALVGILVLLTLPGATAGAASGEIDAAALDLPGASTLSAPALDVLAEGPDLPALEIHANHATVVRLGASVTRVAGPVPGISSGETTIDQRAEHTGATIRLVAGEGEPLVAIRSVGAATGSLEDATVRPVSGIRYAQAYYASPEGTCDGEGSSQGVALCLDAAGVHELASRAADLTLHGTFQILVYGPTVEVQDADGTARYASGSSVAETTGPVERTEDAWVALTLEDASATLRGRDVRAFAALPSLEAGAAGFDRASGDLRVGLQKYQAHREALQATGDLRLELDAAPAGTIPGQDAGAGATTYADALVAHVSGDVSSVNLRAVPVYADSPAATTGAIAAILAALGGVAYYWPRLAFAAASLYTRLKQPEILENDVRSRIYDIIRENPGISAREVHRRSEQSWGTVVYHLRQLERHHLVVSRALGRTRNYYENHGKYKGMEAQLACLQSERALVLARAIVASPGITQEGLAAASGFPQPTTSYYVRKLKQAGLVEEAREGRYARYMPHAELPRFIAISETPQLGQSAPSGVQA